VEASAGNVETLAELVPTDLPAAVFIVRPMGAAGPIADAPIPDRTGVLSSATNIE
jgi:hypothetical protein